MAAALARDEADRRRLSVDIDSCGTGARPGDRATDHAVRACADAKLDISHHSAKNISDISDDEDTLYFVMSRQHEAWLRYVLGIPGERVFILGNGIPDPYGGSLETYRETFRYLRDAIKALFDRIEDDIAVLGADGSRPADEKFEFEIYKAEGEHAPAISMLENHTFTDAWSLPLLADEIDNEDAIFLIASDKCDDPSKTDKKSQRVYGYTIAIITADIAQLLKLCVDEHVRRHGVAEALLRTLMERSVERGCVEMTLEARVSNAPAIALYEKAGFRSLGVRPGFYSSPQEAALIMTADLVEKEEPQPVQPAPQPASDIPEEYEPSDYTAVDYEAADYDPSYVPSSGAPAVDCEAADYDPSYEPVSSPAQQHENSGDEQRPGDVPEEPQPEEIPARGGEADIYDEDDDRLPMIFPDAYDTDDE